MPVQRVVGARRATTFLYIAAALVLSACGDDDERLSPPGTTGGGQGGLGGGGAGGQPPGGGGGEGAYLGDIPVVEEPDTECASPTATPIAVLPAGSDAGLTRVERLGAGWAASGSLGFIGFDDAGGTLAPLTSLTEDAIHAVGVEGATLAMAGVDDEADPQQILFARFDATGVPVVAPVPLWTAASLSSLVGSGPSGSLVAFIAEQDPRLGGPQGLVASFVDAAGTASPAFELTQRGIDFIFTGSAVAAGSGFALAWSIGDTTSSESYFLRASTTGPEGDPVAIALSEGRHRIVRMLPHGGGFALILQGGIPYEAAFVVFLDANGVVVPPAHQYLGAQRALDLAVGPDGLGLVALRSDGVPAFRPLDAVGVPTGPWVCLDGATEHVGVASDGPGWAILRENADLSVDLLRVDAAGDG